ncbi:hypothetical protein [Halobacteriovorax sp. RT-2-4]|uniref:hypothetical protein n=1 Tax=unclassified Halobacteriovorax TaxID=2639665 RepID=UPI00399BFED2
MNKAKNIITSYFYLLVLFLFFITCTTVSEITNNKDYDNEIKTALKLSSLIYKTNDGNLLCENNSDCKLSGHIGHAGMYIQDDKVYVVFKGTDFFSKELFFNFSSHLKLKILFLVICSLFLLFRKQIELRRNRMFANYLPNNLILLAKVVSSITVILFASCTFLYLLHSFKNDISSYLASEVSLTKSYSIEPKVRESLGKRKLIVTGHSKGGVEASIFLNRFNDVSEKRLITFASTFTPTNSYKSTNYLTGFDLTQYFISNRIHNAGNDYKYIESMPFFYVMSIFLFLALAVFSPITLFFLLKIAIFNFSGRASYVKFYRGLYQNSIVRFLREHRLIVTLFVDATLLLLIFLSFAYFGHSIILFEFIML